MDIHQGPWTIEKMPKPLRFGIFLSILPILFEWDKTTG